MLRGSELWFTELGGTVGSNLLVTDNALYIVSGPGGSSGRAGRSVLRSISKQTGITNWSVPLRGSGHAWLLKIGDNVISVDEAGSIAALSGETGVARWQTAVSGGVTANPTIDGAEILVGTSENKIHILSAADGRELSVWASKSAPTAVSAAFDEKVLAGDERGNITLFQSGEQSPIWSHKSGGRVSSVQMTRRGALVASYDNFVYMYSRAGDVVWKRRLPSRPGSVVVMQDSIAVLSTSEEEPSFILDLKTGKILNQLNIPGGEARAAALSGERNFIFLSSGGLSAYSSGGCFADEKRRP